MNKSTKISKILNNAFLIAFLVIFLLISSAHVLLASQIQPVELKLKTQADIDAEIYLSILEASYIVESENNPNAVGDNGRAVGILQIWTVVIDDVNRILGENKYTYQDRWSPEKSREIFEVYVSFYGNQYREITGQDPTAEIYARIWNGGPYGWRKVSTDIYWYKISKYL